MPTPLVAVLGTRYPDLGIEEEVLGTLLAPGSSPIRQASSASLLAAAAEADVVLAGSAPKFTAEVLEGLRCRGVVRYGVGTDSIDLDAARRLGIGVARVSDYGTEAVAFHAVATVCALLRRLTEADRTVRDGGWGFADLRPLQLPSTLTAGRRRLRTHRSPDGHLPAGPRHVGLRVRRVRRGARPTPACAPSTSRRCCAPATSSACTRPATPTARRCSTPPHSA